VRLSAALPDVRFAQARVASVGLPGTSRLSHVIRKFNRFELKYVVPLQAAELFRQALRAYLVPDEHGDAHGRYYLSSLYYDGPDWRFYWEKVDGISFRRKLRIRHYESSGPLTGETPVFVEIKQRLNRVTQKRRLSLPYREALRLCARCPTWTPPGTPLRMPTWLRRSPTCCGAMTSARPVWSGMRGRPWWAPTMTWACA